MTTALATLTTKLATRLNMGDGAGLMETLKATAFKGPVSDAQMTALLIVADQYGLNPWTKEIYAFPDKNNGIVPVVGVDGWARIINSHPQFDGMDFEMDAGSCTCIMFRKDRSHPTRITEWMEECKRGTGPWQSHPKRMLRHKAMIQCARLAFGFVGIYDLDEAERIIESIDGSTGEILGAAEGRKPTVAMPQRKSAAAAPAAQAAPEPAADPNVTDVEPKPAPAAAPAPANGAMASVGEVAYILKKVQARQVSIPQAREMAGLTPGENFEGMTKAEFSALKEVLL